LSGEPKRFSRGGGAASGIKQRFAAVHMMFDWLAVGGVLPFNPATAVRGPKHVVKKGKTLVLVPDEARQLLGSIDAGHACRPARPSAGRPDDLHLRAHRRGVRHDGRRCLCAEPRLWVNLLGKGALPCHHNRETYLHACIDGTGIKDDASGPLFRTIQRGTGKLGRTPIGSIGRGVARRRR
jgi:hypothetical protein